MDKFKANFNHFLTSLICLAILTGCLSCKQSGNPGSSGGQPGDEVTLEKQPGYIIILGGGKTIEDAELASHRFDSREFPFEYSGDFPGIFLSDSIEGLNPGFHICVLGFCKEHKTAEKIRDLVNVTLEEVAYIKKVNHYMASMDCPKIAFRQADYSGQTQVFSGPVRDKVHSVRWSLYSHSEYFEETDCEVVSYTLVVKQGDHEIDAEVFNEICYEPGIVEEDYPEYEGDEEGEAEVYREGEEGKYAEGEMEGYDLGEEYPEEVYPEDLGERLTYEIEKFKRVDRTFILVKSAHAAYDEITYDDKLYGFVDGQIKKVADIFTGAEYTAPYVTYEFIPDYSPDDWKKMAILQTVQYEYHTQTIFEWNDDIQEYEVIDSGDPGDVEP